MRYTAEQMKAIETLTKSLCVDAGAGSGKTSVLVERIVLLLDKKLADLDEIVAITFTDKAAAEMKDRLRHAFHLKAPLDNSDEMTRWRELERNVETARVSTIHSFCASLLRENALRIGLDPDFVVLADAETVLLCDEVATDAVHALLGQENLAAQRAAVAFGTRRLIATMKFMLAKRNLMARVLEEHPLDDPVALGAHWRSLADEVHQQALIRWAGSRGLVRMRDALKGFEGACSNRDDGRETGRCAMVAVLDSIISSVETGRAGAWRSQGADPDRVQAAVEAISDLSFRNTRKKNWVSEQAVVALKELQDQLRKQAKELLAESYDEKIEHEAAQLACDLCAVYLKVDEAYRSAKTDRAGLDFDDLIGNALRMLRENDEVRERTARGIRFLLMDEFQDTDSAQLEIAELIAEHPKGPDLFIVGDAKQSIYDFRGAEVEVFQRERESAQTVVRLDANFRTVTPLLSFVNDFFAGSGLLEAVESDYAPLKAARPAEDPGRIEFLMPETQDGARADDYRKREGDLIASRLSRMCCGDDAVLVFDKDKGGERPATFGDVAILFHSLNTVYLYEDGLRRYGIPYTVVAGAGFYERQEILDLRNLLTVLADPWDEMALLGFLRGPMAGLSDEALVWLCAERGLAEVFWGNGVGKVDLVDDVDFLSRLKAARGLIRDLRGRRAMPLAAFLRYVLERTGYEAIMLTQYLGVQKAYNVRKIVDLADDFARTRPASLGAFVRYLDEMAAQESIREGDAAVLPDGSGAVTLMTIHKAKGLEFPIVVIPDTARSRRQSSSGEVALHRELGLGVRVTDGQGESVSSTMHRVIGRVHKARKDAEHARILYVGMTRARDWLLIAGAPNPPSGSWFSTFDRQYGLGSCEDGYTFRGAYGGASWAAVVRRMAAEPLGVVEEIATSLAGNHSPPTVIGEKEIKLRAEPLTGFALREKILPVSSILDRLFGAFEARESSATEAELAPGDPGEAMGQEVSPAFRGSLVHRLFELWRFDGAPPIEALFGRECPALGVQAVMLPYLRDVAARFLESPLGKRMCVDKRVQREVPFLLRLGATVIRGTIDAMLDDGTLVDYKTGGCVAETRARYEFQLALYGVAVRRLKGVAPPLGLLYYTDCGETCEVELGDRRLDGVIARTEEILRIPRPS